MLKRRGNLPYDFDAAYPAYPTLRRSDSRSRERKSRFGTPPAPIIEPVLIDTGDD